MEKCIGLVGELFGHKFRPRYSEAPTMTKVNSGDARAVVALMEASRMKTYVCDVCERCGTTIKRGA